MSEGGTDLDLYEVELQRDEQGRAVVVLYCCACGVTIGPVDGMSIERMIDEADEHRCMVVDLADERERRGGGRE